MKALFKRKGKDGFSLVELMVVVGIIGVLTAIAVPRYQLFQARAKQSEARINLAHIHMLQTTHHMQYNQYASNFSNATSNVNLNFIVQGGTGDQSGKYYDFTLASGNASGFVANANAAANRLASCQGNADLWQIDENKDVTIGTGLDGC